MKRAWSRWVALLATRETAESLAAMRVVAGAVTFVTLAHAWWSGVAEGLWVAPEHGGVRATDPGLLALVGGLTWSNVRALLVVGLLASAMLTVGVWTRAATLVTWLAFRTLAFSNPWSGGAGDNVLTNVLFLLLLSGAGRAWSIDARRAARQGERDRTVLAWPRWVAAGQLVTIYTAAGLNKMSAAWTPFGSLDAVWYSLNNPIWRRWPVPPGPFIGRLAQGATFGTWVFELGAPVLLLAFYFRATRDRPGRVRRWFNRHDVRAKYLVFGVAMHLGIEITMEVGAFFAAMMALYAACLTPAEWRRIAGALARFGRSVGARGSLPRASH